MKENETNKTASTNEDNVKHKKLKKEKKQLTSGVIIQLNICWMRFAFDVIRSNEKKDEKLTKNSIRMYRNDDENMIFESDWFANGLQNKRNIKCLSIHKYYIDHTMPQVDLKWQCCVGRYRLLLFPIHFHLCISIYIVIWLHFVFVFGGIFRFFYFLSVFALFFDKMHRTHGIVLKL